MTPSCVAAAACARLFRFLLPQGAVPCKLLFSYISRGIEQGIEQVKWFGRFADRGESSTGIKGLLLSGMGTLERNLSGWEAGWYHVCRSSRHLHCCSRRVLWLALGAAPFPCLLPLCAAAAAADHGTAAAAVLFSGSSRLPGGHFKCHKVQ